MKVKLFKSFSVRLALVFMFIMTVAFILLSVTFLFFTHSLVKKSQIKQLKITEASILEKLISYSEKEDLYSKLPLPLSYMDHIPYYLTYIVYNPSQKILIATNDPFLPFLEDTQGKAKHFFIKDYFFDGDLDIFYYAKRQEIHNEEIVIAVAMNLETDTLYMIFSKLPAALFFMAIPVLLLSFLISLLITGNTIKPVIKITKAAQSLTVENLSDLLPLTGYEDEIDELSKTFNNLFCKLKADFVRERQFSSDVSHELNTPLAVILGQVNLLLRWGKDDPEQLQKSLLAIKSESKTMHAIIENLLQISRIESGMTNPHFTEINLGQLFLRLEEEVNSIYPDIKFEISGSDMILKTDEEMLHQILTILISNSVKFSKGTCVIRLEAKKENDSFYIEESDDGPGFSDKSLPYIFERFYRGDQAHSRKIAGSGLGLSIAKTLCNALNAKIEARNMIPHGAGFTLEFKL